MQDYSLIELTRELTGTFTLSMAAFLLAMVMTPVYTLIAYRYKFWKRQRTTSTTGEKLQVFTKLHANKFRRNIPTMAGVIFVIAISLITALFNLDRGQTWLPLAALVGGAAVGLLDDVINVRGQGTGVAGLRSSIKFAMITTIGLGLGWFFFAKIGADSINIPFIGELVLGWLIIPLFAFAVVATGNAVNISDGLDGLAGGLAAISYLAFGIIAIFQSQIFLAGFCFTVVGALLSYLWFNIYPARFFMGDVGSFALGTSLGVVAMLTNTLFLLPIIGVVFVAEAGSSLIQIISKKLFHKKVFISAPVHQHLEASGWPETKVTARFWIVGIVAGFVGVLMAMAGAVSRVWGSGKSRGYMARLTKEAQYGDSTPVRRHRPDYLIVLYMGLLMLLGLIIMYAIGPQRANVLNNAYGSDYGGMYFFAKQVISLILALVAFGLVAFIPYNFFTKHAGKILVIAFISCLVLAVASWLHLGIAQQSLGATRWFNLGPLGSLQPAEFLKFAILIFTAGLLGSRIRQGKLNSFDATLVPIAIITALSLLFIVVIQKDLGTGVALLSIIASMLFVGGINKKNGLIILLTILAMGLVLIVSFPHRIDRVVTYLKGDSTSASDPGSYHIEHAKIAIGTGGMFGVGIGNSVQATGYLPEAINDSVFAIMGETFGFVGLVIIMALFGALLMRMLKIMDHLLDVRLKLLVAGVFGWLSAHVILNVASMIGIFPLTGITLPLLSFGGTSMLFIAAALGLVFQLSHYTVHSSKLTESQNENFGSRRGVGGTRYSTRRGFTRN